MIFQNKSVKISRDSNGIPIVDAADDKAMFFGLGYCHAMDRGIQMMLMKTLGKGEGCLKLQDSDEMLVIDTFFRQYNFCGNMANEVAKFDSSELEKLNAYCAGVTTRFEEKKPWELNKLVGFKEFSWTIEDILMMSRMAGFLTLAQSQGEVEQLFIELVQAGLSKTLLFELFPEALDEYDEDLIKKIKLPHFVIPKEVKWNNLLTPLMASNNWVVGPEKSKSSHSILANDPHLEINRLPAVWYEVILKTPNNYAIGATMPGISALLIGRNKDVSWGATYTFMDALDYWIEDCENGRYLKDSERHDFKTRKEIIERKKKENIEVTFYENEHGVLLGDPNKDGIYLSVAWSGTKGGAASIKQGLSLGEVTNVSEGMDKLGKLEMSFNWLLADNKGNYGFQMSGQLPIRHKNTKGFCPMIGWESKYDWNGFHSPEDLPHLLNPECNFILTANENLSEYGSVNPHTITMGTYRSDRIKELLTQKDKLSTEDMKSFQMDLYSKQAEIFLPFILSHLDESENANILRNWDLKYDINSKGASVFENIYQELIQEVFGKVIGEDVMRYMIEETGYITDFYANFDRILLGKKSTWFRDRSQEEIFNIATIQGLKCEALPWGDRNSIKMKNILVGESLLGFLGFNHRLIPLPGNRATVHQGQVYNSNGRATSFAPSYRMIADMALNSIETNLPGGVSDRRFSKLYKSDIKNWICGNYKILDPS